jgi:hypothetical protein
MGAADPACPLRNAKDLIFKMGNALRTLGYPVVTNAVVFLDPGGLPWCRALLLNGLSKNSNMPTQEELDDLAQADPQQVALGKAKAAFTAYHTMGL